MSALDDLLAGSGQTTGVRFADIEAPGFLTTLKRSGGQMLGGLGEVVGDVAGDPENALARMADDIIARNPSGVNSLADIADKPGLALKEASANVLTFLVPYLGAGKALQVLRAGPAVTTAVQAAIAGMPSLGEIGDTQRETGELNTPLKYAGAGAVGAIENLLGAQRMLGPMVGVKGLGREMTEAEGRRALADPVKTFLKKWGQTGFEEGAEEMMQTPIERATGGKPAFDAPGIDETIFSGAMGALGGLALGPFGAGAHRSQASGLTRQIDEARATLATPLQALDQLPAKQSAADFLTSVTANDFGSARGLEFANAQAEASVQDRDVLLEGIAQKADAEKQVELQKTQQDAAQAAAAERQKQVDDFIKSLESDVEKAAKDEEAARKAKLSEEGAARTARNSGFVQPAMIQPDAPMPTDLLGDPLAFPVSLSAGAGSPPSVNDFISQGLDIGQRFRQAAAVGDQSTAGVLERLAQSVVYDRMAQGLGEPSAGQMPLLGPKGGVTPGEVAARGARVSPRVKVLAAQAAGQINAEQALDLINDIDQGAKPAVIEKRLEAVRGANRPALPATPESAPQGGIVTGRGVDTASTGGSRADVAKGPRVAGGVSTGESAAAPVVPAAAETVVPVVPTTKEKQDGQAQEIPVPAQDADEGQNAQEEALLTPEAIADMKASGKAAKKAERARAKFEKLDNQLAVDDPKVEKARAAMKLAEAEADVARMKANQHFDTQETANATEAQSPAGVDVRQQAEDGKAVGERNAKSESAAQARQAEERKVDEPAPVEAVQSKPAEAPQGAGEATTVPEISPREADIRTRLQAVVDSREAPVKRKRKAAQHLDLLSDPKLNDTAEEHEANLALVEKFVATEQERAEDTAAELAPKLPPNKGWLTNFSRTLLPATPAERSTVGKIRAALRNWFITPEQVAARTTIVQSFSDLAPDVQARVPEAQKSYTMEDAQDKYPDVKFGGYITLEAPAFVKKRTYVAGYWINPTRNELLKAIGLMTRAGHDGDMRMMQDANGDTYVFPAADATHSMMEEGLGIEGAVNLKLFPSGTIRDMPAEAFGNNAVLPKGYTGQPQWQPSMANTRVQAFVLDGHAYMIADNIKSGNEMAVFMHELGAHIGLAEQEAEIMSRINLWAAEPFGSREREVFDKMQARMAAAGEVSDSEKVAYAVEEAVKAGVTPKAVKMGMKLSDVSSVQDLVNWFAQYFKTAVQRMFGNNTRGFDAQHLVDLAYGAARTALANPEVGAGETAVSSTAEPQFSLAADLPEQAARYAGPSGVQLWNDVKNLTRKAILDMTSLPDLVRRYEDRIPALRKMYDAMLAAQTRKIELDQQVDTIMQQIEEAKLTKAQTTALNAFLLDSTTEQKWAYDPGFKRKVEVDSEYEARFNALPPAHQAIIKGIFQHGEDTMEQKRNVFKTLGIEDPFKRLTQVPGPYAPLRRFGNYMVEVKSPALVAEEAKQKTQDGGFADTKKIDELRADPDNYRISFRTTEGAAKRLYNDLMATGRYSPNPKHSYVGVRPERAYTHSEITRSSLVKVLESIKGDDSLSRDIKAKMENSIKDIYHQMMEDNLARQSMRQRKYRAGADEDMLQGFFKQARAEAAFIANMEHAQKINEATYEVSNNKETFAKEQRLQDVVNTMIVHRQRMLDFKDTPVQDFAVGMTSAMQLATSPGYHFANATQVAMKSVPMLASEFNDYSGAWKHVMAGYKLFGKMKSERFDWSKIQNDGLRKTLEMASKMNLIDVGMAEDFDQYNTPRTGYGKVDAGLNQGRKVLHKLRQMSRWVERANRVTSAAAAYNMAMEKGRTHEQAQTFAIRVLEQTQGDFSQLAAPLIIKRLPKFITQYRKYQLMVAALYVRGAYDAFASSSPAERAIARRMIGYMLAHTAMVGGVLGLPLINLAELVIPALFGDEDEPKDMERMIRDWFGDDQGTADFLLKGPLSATLGLDLGAKLSDDRVFSILPYTNIELSKKGIGEALVGLMGPGMAQASKMIDGVALMREGQTAQGVEKLTPRGIEDALKGYRLANEGVTLRNGDVLVKPEDIDTFQALLQGVGLPPAQIKRYQWIKGQQIEITKFYKSREGELKREYIDAAKAGESTTEIEDQWMSLQETKAKMRRYFGDQPDELKSQTLKPLRDAPSQKAKRETKRQETMATN